MLPSDIKIYWTKISRLPEDLIKKVPDNLIDDWKQMGDRRVVDDSNTFIGLHNGARTKAKVYPGEDLNEINTGFRFQRDEVNKLVMKMEYEDENDQLEPLGSVWDSRYVQPDDKEPHGKDYDNVVILFCANAGREQNEFGQLFANAIADQRAYFGIEADPDVNADFPEGRAAKMADLEEARLLPDMPLIPGKTTLLHEIGHSLGLGDEYGEAKITKQSLLLQFPGTFNIGQDEHYSNLEARSDLVHGTPSGSIEPESIKWRWHRIEKSGVLAPLVSTGPAAISATGSQYTIKLRPGRAAAFAGNDIVVLRRRKLGESILRDIEYGQVSARYPFVSRSPQLTVASVDATNDEVMVQPVTAGDLTGRDLAADFPAD